MLVRSNSVVLFAFVVSGAAGLARAQQPAAAVSPEQVRDAVRTLFVEVNHLVEDMEIDLQRDPTSVRLMTLAREVDEEVEHLAHSVEQGANSRHAANDFQNFDIVWHRLTLLAHTEAIDDRHLQKNLARLSQIDAELHRMLRIPVPIDLEQVRGLTVSLHKAAAHLVQDVEWDLWELDRFNHIWRAASDLQEAAEHLDASVSRGITVDHLRNDFSELDGTWRQLAASLRGLNLNRYYHVNQAAARVATLEEQLRTSLGLEPNPTQFSSFRPAPSEARNSLPYAQPGFNVALPGGWRISIPLSGTETDDREAQRAEGHKHSHEREGVAPAPPRPVDPKLQVRIIESLARLSGSDRQAASNQRICPVSGELLGSDGVPVKVRVKDSDGDRRDVFLCCEDCQEKFSKNPAKYLQRLQR